MDKASEKFMTIKSFKGVNLEKKTIDTLEYENGITFKELINNKKIKIGDKFSVKDRRRIECKFILKKGERMCCFVNIDDTESPVFFDFIFTLEEYRSLLGLS